MPARIRPSPLLPAEPVCFMLPLELQYHIIDLSLPLAEFASDDVNATGTHISRAVLLTSYSQVNRAWSSFSQSLLFRHVVLSTSSDVMKLRETLEQFPKFRELVRTIRSGNVNMQPITEGAQNSWIEIGEDFLKLCPWLEELRAAKCRVDLRGLMATPLLKKFYLSASILFDSHLAKTSPPSSLILNDLKELYLVDIAMTSSVLEVLESPIYCILPSLTSVACAFNYPAEHDPNHTPRTQGDLPALSIPNLRAWSTSGPIPSSTTNLPLEFLDCWTDELHADGIRNLPSSMMIIRLNPVPNQTSAVAGEALLAFIIDWGFSRAKFERMRAIVVIMYGGEEYEKSVKQLEKEGKKWKVEVRREIREGKGESAFFDHGFWAVCDSV